MWRSPPSACQPPSAIDSPIGERDRGWLSNQPIGTSRASNDNFVDFGATVSDGEEVLTEECDFWDSHAGL